MLLTFQALWMTSSVLLLTTSQYLRRENAYLNSEGETEEYPAMMFIFELLSFVTFSFCTYAFADALAVVFRWHINLSHLIIGFSIMLAIVAAVFSVLWGVKVIHRLTIFYRRQAPDWRTAARQRILFALVAAAALTCLTVNYRQELEMEPQVYTVQPGEAIPVLSSGSYVIHMDADGALTIQKKP